jgi:hypothetical protein
MRDVGILFYGFLVYFAAIWYSQCSFGTYFSRFGMLSYHEKSGNPGARSKSYDRELQRE